MRVSPAIVHISTLINIVINEIDTRVAPNKLLIYNNIIAQQENIAARKYQ